MAEMFLGQIPEAIYCACFMIACKNIKEKRLLFILLMIMDYLLLKQIFIFNSWFQLLYVVLTFIILKVLYKDKAKIFDIFYMILCYLFIIIVSIPCFLIFGSDMILANFINKFLLFLILFLFKNKLNKLENAYYKFWNVDKENKKKVKAITFRSINILIMNIIFIIINICMIIAVLFNK